jgi:predicted transcriptional regulator
MNLNKKKMAIPTEVATEEELEAIERGMKQIENGEYSHYKSVDELRQELIKEDNEEKTK